MRRARSGTVRRWRQRSDLAPERTRSSRRFDAASAGCRICGIRRLFLAHTVSRVLLAAIGVGAVLGPLLLRRFVRPGDKRWLFGPFAVRGAVDLTLAAVANPVVAGGALVAYGMSTSTGMVAYQSTLQTLVPVETRGRAFAFYDVLWNTARLLSLAVGGVIAELADVRVVYVLSALLLFAAAVVGLTTKLEAVPGAATIATPRAARLLR